MFPEDALMERSISTMTDIDGEPRTVETHAVCFAWLTEMRAVRLASWIAMVDGLKGAVQPAHVVDSAAPTRFNNQWSVWRITVMEGIAPLFGCWRHNLALLHLIEFFKHGVVYGGRVINGDQEC